MESLAIRVAVGEVDDSAELGPDLFAFEHDAVACLEILNARGEVDIVSDEPRLPRRKL